MRQSLIYRKAQGGIPVNPYTGGQVAGMGGGRSSSGGGGKKGGSGTGAIIGMANTAIDMVMPFLDAAATKKQKKKFAEGYESRGLRDDKAMEQYAEATGATIDALNTGSRQFGSLYGGFQRGGLLYQGKRTEVGPTSGFNLEEQRKISYKKPMYSPTYDYMNDGNRHVGWKGTDKPAQAAYYKANPRATGSYPTGYNASNVGGYDPYSTQMQKQAKRKVIQSPPGGF